MFPRAMIWRISRCNYTSVYKQIRIIYGGCIETAATLVLHTYFIFTYEADVKKGMLSRQKIREYGTHIVYGISKKIIHRVVDDTGYNYRFFSG